MTQKSTRRFRGQFEDSRGLLFGYVVGRNGEPEMGDGLQDEEATRNYAGPSSDTLSVSGQEVEHDANDCFLLPSPGVRQDDRVRQRRRRLAEIGRHVLVVDLDAQACATSLLGRPVGLDNSVLAALLAERPLRAVIQRTSAKHLWLAPACAELSRIEQMGAVPDPERATPDGRLSEVALVLELQEFQEPFDYVLLDCPNQPISMHRLVLVACDEVIVPVGFSLEALYATTPTLQLILAAQKVRGDGGPSITSLDRMPAYGGHLLIRIPSKSDHASDTAH